MSEFCVYTVADNSTSEINLVCMPRDIVTHIGPVNGSASDNLFFSKVAIGSDMDQVWVVFCGILVFFMQLGFTMLEAGVVKAPNVQHILFKNLMDTCFASIAWWLFGYCVAFGVNDENGFIGTENVALWKTPDNEWQFWFFQFAFATTAATIVSGAVAERCTMEAYAIYTVFLICWVYPVVVHWIWDTDGFLSAFNDDASLKGGVIDFAGCGVVHMVGGFSALIGAIFLGPRLGRFDHNSKYANFLGNNVPLQILGMFVLWLGWYGFNCGSTLLANGAMELASRIAVNTTFGATSGGLTCAIVSANLEGYWSVPRIVNGILVGLVSVTSSCAVIEPGLAMATGMFGALVYYLTSRILEKLEIDDPLDAFAVHGAGGMWGLLSVGLFAVKKDILEAGYNETIAYESHGDRFGHQLVACLCIIGWVCVNAIPLFAAMKYLRILRVSTVVEENGLDWEEHGGNAVLGLNDWEQSSVGGGSIISPSQQDEQDPASSDGNNSGPERDGVPMTNVKSISAGSNDVYHE